jgi:hypothetical protein
MTRAAILLCALLVALLLAACNAARVDAPASDAVTAAPGLPNRAVQVDHGLIVEVRIQYEDGFIQVIRANVGVATPTPDPTQTAVPQATATVTPTLTPIPTNTPRPTVTPTPQPTFTATPTQAPILTPTPQSTVQPPTPLPTLPAPDEVCYGTVKADGLRFRDSPVTGTVIGSWSLNERVRILAVLYNGADEWAQIRGANDRIGWSAAYYQGQVYIAYDNSPECLAVRFPETFLDGFHVLDGGGRDSVLAYPGKFRLIKCLNGSFQTCAALKALDPTVKTIYRTYLHDCPPAWVYTSPQAWWDMIQAELPRGSDWIEIENECAPPPELFPLWAEFSIQMAQIVEQERGAAILAFSFAPGHPDIHEWRALWPYLEWSKTRIAPNGRQHGVALHSSAFAPSDVALLPGSWINNPFLAGREEIFCNYARDNYGYSCDGVVFIETEMGFLDGYSGNKQIFSCHDQALIYRETIRRKVEIGIVDGFTLWNIGKIGIWSSVHECLREMLS